MTNRAACLPISSRFCETLDRLGDRELTPGMSSKPVIAWSFGST